MGTTADSLAGAHRHPAPYLQSHPRIPARELADALDAGNDRCTWSWRDNHAPFALANCKFLSADIVEITLISKLLKSTSAGHILISVRRASTYPDPRWFSLFICPQCKKSRKHIVYNWRWSCDSCSGLLYRSQRIGGKVSAWERRDELERLVSLGRPKGMHHNTFGRLMAELDELRTKHGSNRAAAPREYLLTLDRTWGPIPAQEAEPARGENLKGTVTDHQVAPSPSVLRLDPEGPMFWS